MTSAPRNSDGHILTLLRVPGGGALGSVTLWQDQGSWSAAHKSRTWLNSYRMRVRGGRQGSLFSKSQPEPWTSRRACGPPGMGPCFCAPWPLMIWTQELPSSPTLAMTTPGQPCLGSFPLLPPPPPTLPQAEPKSFLFPHQVTALPTASGPVQAASYCTLL